MVQQELGLDIGLRVHGAPLSPIEATKRQNSTHGLSGNHGGDSEELEENQLPISVTQGIYSDGLLFGFILITEDGIVEKSSVFDLAKKGLQMVFSFIVSRGMMETAMKSTPTTKPSLQRDRGFNSFHNKVLSKSYAPYRGRFSISFYLQRG